MSEANQYGRESRLYIKTSLKDNKTVLQDLYFSAPLKVMKPFHQKDGSIEVMQLSASAGLLEGDRQIIDLSIGDGTKIGLISQSFEKIHKMSEGWARRVSTIDVGQDACLDYRPLPVIPFADSAFESKMTVNLKDASSKFVLSEILSCGRSFSKERFAYREYKSQTSVYTRGRLIYRDNTHYIPAEFPMDGIGMYEGYTHMANMVFFNFDLSGERISEIYAMISGIPDICGGVSRLHSGDVCVKILGNGAEPLIAISGEIVKAAQV